MAGIAIWAFTSILLRHPVGLGSFSLAIFLCLHLLFPSPTDLRIWPVRWRVSHERSSHASLLWYDYGCLGLASAACTKGCDDWRIS